MLRKGLALAALGLVFLSGPAAAATHPEEPKDVRWSFEGPVGKFDQAQLQRGYKVYREVCSACHSMNLMYFRNLGQKGGPFYDPKYPNPNDNPYVKALAADIQVNDIDSETGDVVQRPATSADKFPAPFPNEAAARASNGGALPPDLSLMTKAREGGPDYVYNLLLGYDEPPAGFNLMPGMNYNKYFPGHQIGMAKQIQDGLITYADGAPNDAAHVAKDVTAFLHWVAEPKLEARHDTGLRVMLYTLLFTILAYIVKRHIWARFKR